MDDKSLFIGIDFGTSKCAMSWYNPKSGQAEILRNHEGREDTPSIVYLGQSKSELLVGGPAQDILENEENRTYDRFFTSVKRDLRADWRKILDDETVYEPTDIAAALFGKLKHDAEELHFHGQKITRAVITYPASFDVLQQDRIKVAAGKAGFEDIKLLPEPEAAALAYSCTALDPGKCLLIYDFGAGTFDVAVVASNSDETFSLLMPPKGLKNCGGDDLDRELYSYCDEIAKKDLGRSISLTEDLDLNFLRTCQKRKENLSREAQKTFSTYLHAEEGSRPPRFSHTVTRSAFEERIRHHIERTVSLTQKILQEAAGKGSSVDTVVLIGGSSRVPLVRNLLASTLPVQPREWQQRDFAVALGAAYHGHNLWKSTQAQGSVRKKSPVPEVQASVPINQPKRATQSPPKSPPIQPAKGPQSQPGKPEPAQTQQVRPAAQRDTPSAQPARPLAVPVSRPQPAQPARPSEPLPNPALSATNTPRPLQHPVPQTSPDIPKSFNNIDKPFPINRRPSRNKLELVFSTLFLLLFGFLAFMEIFKGMHILVYPLPWIGPNVGWPVTTILFILALYLFARSTLSKILSFLLVLLSGIATVMLLRSAIHIILFPNPETVLAIGWPVMAVLTVLSFWLFILKLIDRRY